MTLVVPSSHVVLHVTIAKQSETEANLIPYVFSPMNSSAFLFLLNTKITPRKVLLSINFLVWVPPALYLVIPAWVSMAYLVDNSNGQDGK